MEPSLEVHLPPPIPELPSEQLELDRTETEKVAEKLETRKPAAEGPRERATVPPVAIPPITVHQPVDDQSVVQIDPLPTIASNDKIEKSWIVATERAFKVHEGNPHAQEAAVGQIRKSYRHQRTTEQPPLKQAA